MKSWFGSDKLPSVVLSLVLIAAMTAAVSYSPTLYRLFCAATGYGGAVTVKRSLVTDTANPAIGPEITVRLDTNVSPGLDWDFKPEQPSVKTHIGLPTTVFFLARNRSKETVVARATYNVTPDAAGFYFTKTQCFCFSEETLKPGESARMPVVFYIDPDISSDIDSKNIRTITLSYTFFRQAEAVASARSLGERAEAQTEVLKTAKEAEFEPAEVRRR
jgi:cytochrome c oxidase assembly protein subunit 11